MHGYSPIDSYRTADNYDKFHIRGDEEDTAKALHSLEANGPALELAIGTGRIALLLSRLGVKVEGVDFSEAMIKKLREKDPEEAITTTIADIKSFSANRKYGMIYIVFNTLFNLITQEEQLECFINVSKYLNNGAYFVVEGGLPTEFCNLSNNQYVRLEQLEMGMVGLDVARYDQISQVLEETHIRLMESKTALGPIVTRYIWPAEMDLMARVAGLVLVDRWSDWMKTPIQADSKNCISIYQRPNA